MFFHLILLCENKSINSKSIWTHCKILLRHNPNRVKYCLLLMTLFADFTFFLILLQGRFAIEICFWEKNKPEACLWKHVHLSSPLDCSYLGGLFCLMGLNQPSSPTIPISVFQLLLSGGNHLVMNSLISGLYILLPSLLDCF